MLSISRLLLLTSLLAAASLVGQRTLRVPSQHPDLATALAAASAGDEIVLETRANQQLARLSLGVTIRATAGQVNLSNPNSSPTIAIPRGQRARLENLQFSSDLLARTPVEVAGDVLFDQCSFRGLAFQGALPALRILPGARVAMVRCFATNLTPGGHALEVQGGWLSIASSTFSGGGASALLAGGHGLVIGGGAAVEAAGLRVFGGPASPSSAAVAGDGISIQQGSLSAADCDIRGGASVAANGNGIWVAPGATARVADCSFRPGLNGSVGQGVVGFVQTVPLLRPDLLRWLAIPRGAAWTIDVRGRAGQVVVLPIAVDFAPGPWPAFTTEPLWIDPATAIVGDWTVLDAQGRGTLAVFVPSSLPPGIATYQLAGATGGRWDLSVAGTARY